MKNFIQSIKSLATFLVFAIFLCAPGTMHAAPTPELSSEDLKMLEEIGKEVERYVNALPTEAQLRAQGVPEEEIKKRETKEKFDAEVKRYSEMSESQLLEEMEKVFSEAATQAPQQPQPEIAKPTYTSPTPPAEPKPVDKPIVPSDKQLAAIKLIDTVLISINNFMNKAQIMVELPGKIPTWVKEGKLRNWPVNLSWNSFVAQIDEFQAKLNKVKDRDSRSGAFKYLDDFIKDESLNNNLAKVRDSLLRNEPKIQLSSAIDKMSTDSRTAVRSVLLSLHEATAILAIPAELDKIFEKYDPTAKKIKESEEAAQKRALEESRRGRYPGAAISSSAPQPERAQTYGRGRDADRFGTSSLEAPAKGEDKKSDALKPGDKGTGGKEGGEKKAEAGKKEEDQKNTAAKKADNYEKEFTLALDEFGNTVHENVNFANIEKHVKSADAPDKQLPDLIKTATDTIGKAASAARNLKRHLANVPDSLKKQYKKTIKDSYKDARKEVDSINTQITNVSKQSQVLATVPMGANPKHRENISAKYSAYFGKQSGVDYEAQIETKKEELEKLNESLEPKMRRVNNAKAKAEQDEPPSELSADMKKLDTEVKEGKTQAKNIEKEIKRLQNILDQAGKGNLNDLQTKIKELKKAVDDLAL